jgi:hypothetical protein
MKNFILGNLKICGLKLIEPEQAVFSNIQSGPLKKKKEKGRRFTSHRCDRLPLLPSGPGGVQQELVV